MATFITRRAPAASNYADDVGKVVTETAVAAGFPRCTIAADQTVVPLGIITHAENEDGGVCTICISGVCKAYAGDAITPGTDTFLSAEAGATGYVVPRADPKTDYVVGRALAQQVKAAGELLDVLVAVTQLDLDT